MSLKALLIEDSKTIRDNLIPALELSAIRVLAVAETENEALAGLQAHPDWDLIIVDLFLREGSGLGVLRACQSRTSHQHVVVLTNYSDLQIRAHCLALQADAVFDKSKELEAFFAHCSCYPSG